MMRPRKVRAVIGVCLAILLVASAGCGRKGSSKSIGPASSAVVVSAVFEDGGARGVVGVGDTITVTFSEDVFMMVTVPTPLASALFNIHDAGGLGASTVVQTGGPLKVTIQCADDAVFDPDGIYGTDPNASGIDARPGQVVIRGQADGWRVGPSSPVDIESVPGWRDIGTWTAVSGVLNVGRSRHTATLLENGEILIVGGLAEASSLIQPDLRLMLDSIEIFDPVSEGFTVSPGRLVHGRSWHKAVKTPGVDGLIDTFDDWVVIVGGYTSMRPGLSVTEGSVEVIVPDPDGDTFTDDLVVNPDSSWQPLGTPLIEAPTFDLDKGLDPVTGLCTTETVSLGMFTATAQWVPEAYLRGPGNNEIYLQGGPGTSFFWNDCDPRLLDVWWGHWTGFWAPSPNPNCDVGYPYIAIQQDPLTGAPTTGEIVGLVDQGSPPPYSLLRMTATQTRIPGPDGVDGTVDDVHVLWGGSAVLDFKSSCAGNLQCSSWWSARVTDLEYWNPVTGRIYTGVHDAYSTCGSICSQPGEGLTNREQHVAVATGNPDQEVVLIGGSSSGMTNPGIYCARAIEVIRPDWTMPTHPRQVRYAGLDVPARRVYAHDATLIPGSGGILITGGIDFDIAESTSNAAYSQPAYDWVAPVPDMLEARDGHAQVTLPAGTRAGIPEDRVYVFGGTFRQGTTFPWCGYSPSTGICVGDVYLSSAEYFKEIR